MALILLQPGEVRGIYGGFGLDNVFGSTGNETAVIDGNGKVILDGSFNAGGDTIRILGNAGNYTANVVGSTLVLTNAGGANIVIPFGVAGATIQFADVSRTLAINTTTGTLQLGTQVIATTGATEVADGPGGPVGPVEGDEIFLTANTDAGGVFNGTAGDDMFIADLNQVNGLQVNTLGTGDRLGNQTNDLGGYDVLEAQLTRGSTYGDGNAAIQPRLNGVNEVKIEALQSDLPNNNYYDDYYVSEVSNGNNTQVYVNAKDIRGHDEIWSWRSDADLTVLDVTTVLANGGHDNAKNTGDITIGMGYTGSDNTKWNASDMSVYFDPDYLLSGQTAQSAAYFFLLDEDADLAHRGTDLLERINVDGLRFRVDGGPIITLRDPATTGALTHVNFVSLLQDELAALKAAGVVPADLQLFVDPSIFDSTFLDNGDPSSNIPAIVLKTNTSAVITPVGFSQIEEPIGAYDVYGRIDDQAAVADLPVSVKIALEKAGEGALLAEDGGALIVGAMDKYEQGIPVFNVTVYGDESRPSILRYLDSTADVLDVINIVSDNDGFPTDTWASLKIGSTNEGMSLIDASGFKGDLELGAYSSIQNLETLLANGGGDVTFFGSINSSDAYSYTTGAGNDRIQLSISGEALDRDGDGLAIVTGDGDDYVATTTELYGDENPNQIILDNVNITTGNGNDTVWTRGEGNFRIGTGTGNDTVYTDNSGAGAEWVFNVDRGDYSVGESTTDLPGVPLQYSLIGGGRLTVTFSGAGIAGDQLMGGVMTDNGDSANLGEAFAFKNGIESAVTIDVAGTRSHYGTQKDINDAILKAINDHPVLSKLLVASIADNNTLVVRSLIDGTFRTEDLDISITRPTGNFTTSMINEAAGVGISTTGITTATAIGSKDLFGPGYGMSLNNAFYSGVNNNNAGTNVDADAFYNLNSTGIYGQSNDSDNIVNGGDGDDVIVLAAHQENSNPTNGYYSLDGYFYDEASNDLIRMTGDYFGKDTIINFVVAGVDTYADQRGGLFLTTNPNSGFDVLDFTAYMAAPLGTFVTLDDYSGGNVPVDFAGVTVNPAEVVILDFISDLTTGDGDGVETFAGLTAQRVQDTINNTPSFVNWGNFEGGEFALDDSLLPGQSVSAVILVQNDQNLGQYKVFQVTWTDDQDNGAAPSATVIERGELDFGTSLSGSANDLDGDLATGIDELNLFGSFENTFFGGHGVNQLGPDNIPHWV